MNIFTEKLHEVIMSVMPIAVIVLILNFTMAHLPLLLVYKFLVGSVLVVIGLTLFLCGVDIGVTPIGNLIGPAITKSNNVVIVVCAALLLGFVISVAEPDLHILAGQVAFVSSGVISKFSIVLVVSIGIAVLMTSGLLRIVYSLPMRHFLLGFYGLVLILSFFSSSEFLAISFDASGATTGALTVPFMLALAQGIATMKKNSKASEEDSFGLVGITSIGAIIAVLVMSIVANPGKITASAEIISEVVDASVFGPFMHHLPVLALEVALALAPLVLIFFVAHYKSLKLSPRALRKIIIGLVYAYIGLVIFLLGVNAGFMELGTALGHAIAMLPNKVYLVMTAFCLGLVTILAEPAVYVLTRQIEDVTTGSVRRKAVLIALALGVGGAVALSMVRILTPEIQLWHYLLPGYAIALVLAYIVPTLFVGIAFDSGGVASGPMTATFILAFAHGAAEAIDGADVMIDGFGMIAMVALTPLIALQLLGLIFMIQSKKKSV